VEKELRSGADIVLVAKSGAEAAPFTSLVVELRKVFRDAGLLADDGIRNYYNSH
jgi:RNase P protein component